MTNSKATRKSWTVEEERLLSNAVEKYGKRWSLISKELPNRTLDQCRERWRTHLDPRMAQFHPSCKPRRYSLKAEKMAAAFVATYGDGTSPAMIPQQRGDGKRSEQLGVAGQGAAAAGGGGLPSSPMWNQTSPMIPPFGLTSPAAATTSSSAPPSLFEQQLQLLAFQSFQLQQIWNSMHHMSSAAGPFQPPIVPTFAPFVPPLGFNYSAPTTTTTTTSPETTVASSPTSGTNDKHPNMQQQQQQQQQQPVTPNRDDEVDEEEEQEGSQHSA